MGYSLGLAVIALFLFGIGIASTVLWIWMLVECATKESNEGNDKLVWILMIIFAQLIGALIYLLVRRPKRIEELGR
jgi:phospholipase D-like protein